MKPTKHARFIASLILVAGAMLASTPAGAAGGATQLPLSDFLTAQGTSATFQPPSPDEVGWSGRPPDYPHLGWMDYAGLANAWLVAASGGFLNMGTQVSGSFLRRDLTGGKVQYEVDLHATNAMAWMLPLPAVNFGTDPLLFGARPPEVLAGAAAALGECHFKWVWREDADQPIPDLIRALIIGDVVPQGFELVRLSFRGTANGPIHALAGLGPEGTPGKMVISQTGLFTVTGKGATADGFPAEVVDLHVVGQ